MTEEKPMNQADFWRTYIAGILSGCIIGAFIILLVIGI